MCSIGEDDFGDDGGARAMEIEQISSNLTTLDLNAICKKCEKDTIIVKLPFKEPQCKECFLNYVRHKLRAALGSSKLVNRNGNVLLLFDGHEQSTVLLDIITFSVTQKTFKKLHINLKILIIDSNCCKTEAIQTTVERETYLLNMRKILDKYPFEKYYTTIGKCDSSVESITNIDNINDFEKFQLEETDYLMNYKLIKNLTSKYDYLERKRENLLETCANALDCKYIFVAQINSDLAKTLLTNIALGRGHSVANDVAFSTERKCSIQIIRPIRDLNPMEIQTYIRVNEIECLPMMLPATTNNPNSDTNINININSIQSLTNKFVNDLQINFPSTVATVFKTGDKIAIPSNSVNDRGSCLFCTSTLDYDQSNTLYATEFSRAISEHANEMVNCESFQHLEVIAKNAVNGQVNLNQESNEMLKNLCHGCRNIYRDGNGFILI